MNLPRTVIAALTILLPLAAHAIEPSAAVRVTPLLKTTRTWDGTPIRYPAGEAEITGLLIEVAPGGETRWHEHPVPSFGMVLEGTLEVTVANGKVKRIRAGEALAEVINTAHNGRNVGKEKLKLIVFYAGAVGTPVTVQHPDQPPNSTRR